MRKIEFPTIIIQMKKKHLHNSMIYYVILNSAAGRYVGDIVGLLFARPCRSGKVRRAELLPLHMIRSGKHNRELKVAPMLSLRKYRCLFEQGCTFKVTAIEFGRRSDSRRRLWKNYNLRNLEIHDLLRRLLHLDIGQIPGSLLKQMKPLRLNKKHPETRRRQRKSYLGLLQEQRSRIQPIRKEPYNNINCLHQGSNYAAGSNFVYCYKTIPSQMHTSKYVLDDFLTKGKYNVGNNPRKLNKFHFKSNII